MVDSTYLQNEKPRELTIKDIEDDLKNYIIRGFIKKMLDSDLLDSKEAEYILLLNDDLFPPLYCELIP